MKIISWNVNGIRSINGQNPSKKYNQIIKENKLFAYIEREKPDILCIQETKAEPEQIYPELRIPEGYYGFYNSCKIKKGYSGVVTYTKIKPHKTISDIGISEFDQEGRIVAVDFEDFVLFNIYFPNGTSGYHRVEYKLAFYDGLFGYISKNLQDRKIIVCGDYNTAHFPIDLARPDENINTSGFLPEERVKLDELVSAGWVDTFRHFNKEPDNYTWWSNRARARENNVGWRIDYHFVTQNLLDSVIASYHHTDQPGSDHCPIVLETNF